MRESWLRSDRHSTFCKKLKGNSSEREEEKKDKKYASGHTIGLADKPIKIFTIHLFIVGRRLKVSKEMWQDKYLGNYKYFLKVKYPRYFLFFQNIFIHE